MATFDALEGEATGQPTPDDVRRLQHLVDTGVEAGDPRRVRGGGMPRPSRGEHFDPALSVDELAFYDAVATNESAVRERGDDVLAPDRPRTRGRDAPRRPDGLTVGDDVRATLRSSIKRRLVKYDHPPGRQPEAIELVLEQMEAMARRYAHERASG